MNLLRLRRIVRPQSLLTASRTLTSLSTTCPACTKPLPTPLPICPACAHISKLPADTKYHALFGLPEDTFQLDVKDLRNRFLQTQRLTHPDLWVAKPEKLKTAAAGYSSLLNEAYQTLKSPLKRAEYLLSLRGVELGEADTLDEGYQEFMLQLMDHRETIESAESREDIEPILEEAKLGIEEDVKDFEQAYIKGELALAKAACIRLKYRIKVQESAQAKLDAM